MASKGYRWADGFIGESVARSDGRDIFVHVSNSRIAHAPSRASTDKQLEALKR
jgi:cold shock CspA family protein